MTQTTKGFQVKLEGFELEEAVVARIEYNIQQVVMRELAAHLPQPDFDNVRSGVAIIVPRLWAGFILRNLEAPELNTLAGNGLNKDLQIR